MNGTPNRTRRRVPRSAYRGRGAARRERRATRRRQRGVALAISLVLLVAMTVVGIATLAGTRLDEKVTSNAQQKSVAFEVAESAIDTVWSATALMDSVGSIPREEFDDPAAIAPGGVSTELSTAFDQTKGAHKSIDIDGEVTIRYCGESPLPSGSDLSADESGMQLAGALFDVNGVATIVSSATRAEHVQRGALVRPRTGRRGDCVVPGL